MGRCNAAVGPDVPEALARTATDRTLSSCGSTAASSSPVALVADACCSSAGAQEAAGPMASLNGVPLWAAALGGAALTAALLHKVYSTPSRTYGEKTTVGDEYDAWTEEVS